MIKKIMISSAYGHAVSSAENDSFTALDHLMAFTKHSDPDLGLFCFVCFFWF